MLIIHGDAPLPANSNGVGASFQISLSRGIPVCAATGAITIESTGRLVSD